MLKRLARSIYAATPFKPAAMHLLHAMWRPPERLYRHLHFRGQFELDLPNGAQLRLHHFGNQVENDLFWSGFGKGWESASLITWLWLVRDADTVIDIGANTGIYALSAQASRPTATVIAVEPVSRVHARLLQNIALNRYPTRALNLALSDHNGSVSLYDPGGDHAYSASLNAQMLGDNTQVSSVEALRLDDLLDREESSPVDVMKIDVEMHEPEVIAGASSCILRDRPTMLIEILDKVIGTRLADALPGYVFYEIGERLEKTRIPGGANDRNYLVLPQDDPRVARLGEATDITAVRGWI